MSLAHAPRRQQHDTRSRPRTGAVRRYVRTLQKPAAKPLRVLVPPSKIPALSSFAVASMRADDCREDARVGEPLPLRSVQMSLAGLRRMQNDPVATRTLHCAEWPRCAAYDELTLCARSGDVLRRACYGAHACGLAVVRMLGEPPRAGAAGVSCAAATEEEKPRDERGLDAAAAADAYSSDDDDYSATPCFCASPRSTRDEEEGEETVEDTQADKSGECAKGLLVLHLELQQRLGALSADVHG